LREVRRKYRFSNRRVGKLTFLESRRDYSKDTPIPRTSKFTFYLHDSKETWTDRISSFIYGIRGVLGNDFHYEEPKSNP